MAIKILRRGSKEFFTIDKSTTLSNKGSKAVDGNAGYFETKRAHKGGVYPEDIEQALTELSNEKTVHIMSEQGVPRGEINLDVIRNENGDFILSTEYYDKLRLCYGLDASDSKEAKASIEAISDLGEIIGSAQENSTDNKKALQAFNANIIKHFLQTDINETETLQAQIKLEVGALQQNLEFNSPSWWQRARHSIMDALDKVFTTIVNFFKDVWNKLGFFKTSDLEKRQAAFELELQAKSPEIYKDKNVVGQLKDLMADFDQLRSVGTVITKEAVETFIANNRGKYADIIRKVSATGKDKDSTALALPSMVKDEIAKALSNVSSAIANAYQPRELDDAKVRDQLARDNRKPDYMSAKDKTQETKDTHRHSFDEKLQTYFDKRRNVENVNQNDSSMKSAESNLNSLPNNGVDVHEKNTNGLNISEKNNIEFKYQPVSDNENVIENNKNQSQLIISTGNHHEFKAQPLSADKKLDNLLKFITENTIGWTNISHTYFKTDKVNNTNVSLPRCVLDAYMVNNTYNVQQAVNGLKADIGNGGAQAIITKLQTYMQQENTEYNAPSKWNSSGGYNTVSLKPALKEALSDVKKLENVLQYGAINKPQPKGNVKIGEVNTQIFNPSNNEQKVELEIK